MRIPNLNVVLCAFLDCGHRARPKDIYFFNSSCKVLKNFLKHSYFNSPELDFVTFYGAQELLPRNRVQGSLKFTNSGSVRSQSELEFLNNLWGLGTE